MLGNGVNGVLANNLQTCGAVLLLQITLLKLKGMPSFWVCLLYQGRYFVGHIGCIVSQLSTSDELGSKVQCIINHDQLQGRNLLEMGDGLAFSVSFET